MSAPPSPGIEGGEFTGQPHTHLEILTTRNFSLNSKAEGHWCITYRAEQGRADSVSHVTHGVTSLPPPPTIYLCMYLPHTVCPLQEYGTVVLGLA